MKKVYIPIHMRKVLGVSAFSEEGMPKKHRKRKKHKTHKKHKR